MTTAPVVAYLEDPTDRTDPPALSVTCPVCATEPGIWCAVAVASFGEWRGPPDDQKPFSVPRRIGYVHEDRVEAANACAAAAAVEGGRGAAPRGPTITEERDMLHETGDGWAP